MRLSASRRACRQAALLGTCLLAMVPTLGLAAHHHHRHKTHHPAHHAASRKKTEASTPAPLDSATDQIARVHANKLSPEGLLALYAAQIRKHDADLHAIIALNRQAESAAAPASLDAPLFGLPILIKDNIETSELIPTTAGSTALTQNIAHKDAALIARLRKGGAVIIGKANLSEWANFRSTMSTSGWSAVGGLTRNPWDKTRTACGSSSGSAAGVAAGFAGAAIGTETDGSITCPASMNGIVGFKPTLGLVSRSGIIPLSPAQDTPGPLARTVRDAALLLTIMAGSDPDDAATSAADPHKTDYTQHLSAEGLKGVRLGVLRFAVGRNPDVRTAFDAALEKLKAQGAILVEIPTFDRKNLGDLELKALLSDFHASLDRYLGAAPDAVVTRNLKALIAFDAAHAQKEMPYFAQDLFERAEAAPLPDDPAIRAARATAHRLAGPDGIDALLAHDHLDALIAPTAGPAPVVDLVNGARSGGGIGAGDLAAVAGYPHLTVPMALVRGLPVGLSFIGPAWSDEKMLDYGYAWEQARGTWSGPKGF